MEFLVASAIFVIAVISISYVVVDAGVASRQGTERSQAMLYAKEGLEAARNIRNRDYNALANGTYGLTSATGTWSFSGTSDVPDGYTRHIDVATYDSSSKIVTSTVDWNFSTSRHGQVSYTTILANLAPATMSGRFTFNSAGHSTVGNTMSGVLMGNSGAAVITITQISVAWSPTDTNQINRIRLRLPNNGVWTQVFTQPPLATNGQVINTTDYNLAAGTSGYTIETRFQSAYAGHTYTFTYYFSDGSVFIAPAFAI